MAGLQTSVYVAASVTWIAALAALILRVIARHMTKQRWWFDDYFCLAAFVSLLCAVCVLANGKLTDRRYLRAVSIPSPSSVRM